MRYILILLIFLNSCDNQPLNPQPLTFDFQHEEYWFMKNIKWKTLSEEAKWSPSSLMIFKDKNANWGIVFLGSLTKYKDTIKINQESGYDITYTKIGRVKIGDSIFVDTELFLRMNNSLIEYGGYRFVRSKIPVISGFEFIERNDKVMSTKE